MLQARLQQIFSYNDYVDENHNEDHDEDQHDEWQSVDFLEGSCSGDKVYDVPHCNYDYDVQHADQECNDEIQYQSFQIHDEDYSRRRQLQLPLSSHTVQSLPDSQVHTEGRLIPSRCQCCSSLHRSPVQEKLQLYLTGKTNKPANVNV